MAARRVAPAPWAREDAGMDSLPESGVLTRWVLENPWPLAVLLTVAGAILGWTALDRGSARRLAVAAGLLACAGAALLCGWLVVTPGEHAVRVTAALVDAAERGDVPAMERLLADQASIHWGSLTAPGLDRAEIERGFAALAGPQRIVSNAVTRLRGAGAENGDGVTELACLTTTQGSFGPVPSEWMFRVRRQPDGHWLIEQMACRSLAGRRPGARPW